MYIAEELLKELQMHGPGVWPLLNEIRKQLTTFPVQVSQRDVDIDVLLASAQDFNKFIQWVHNTHPEVTKEYKALIYIDKQVNQEN